MWWCAGDGGGRGHKSFGAQKNRGGVSAVKNVPHAVFPGPGSGKENNCVCYCFSHMSDTTASDSSAIHLHNFTRSSSPVSKQPKVLQREPVDRPMANLDLVLDGEHWCQCGKASFSISTTVLLLSHALAADALAGFDDDEGGLPQPSAGGSSQRQQPSTTTSSSPPPAPAQPRAAAAAAAPSQPPPTRMQFDPLKRNSKASSKGGRGGGSSSSSSSSRPALTPEVNRLQEDLAALMSEWSQGGRDTLLMLCPSEQYHTPATHPTPTAYLFPALIMTRSHPPRRRSRCWSRPAAAAAAAQHGIRPAGSAGADAAHSGAADPRTPSARSSHSRSRRGPAADEHDC